MLKRFKPVSASIRALNPTQSFLSSRATTRPFTASSLACGAKRIPSFADIKAVELDKYMVDPVQNPTLAQLRKEAMQKKTEESAAPADEALVSRLFKSFLFGSAKTKKEVQDLETSFSTQLMRGKYVHEVVVHKVLPEKALEYLDLV